MRKDEFEPKEEIINHGCETCLYEHLSEREEPCCDCKYNIDPSSLKWLKAKDCFKPKEKEHSSNCTISSKEGNENFTNGDYGFKEISKDEIDMVNHPKHYNRDGAMECMDEMITVFGGRNMIPKEIREKAELAIKFNDEILEYLRREYNFKDDFDYLDIVNEPSGKKLQDGSYECWYPDYYDTVYYKYYPMDNGKYLEIMYRK